jgi:hypothetical protein
MKKTIAITGIVSLFFLSSCVTINEFPIEVFQPAKVGLPSEIKNVTIVSRNMKYTNDTLQNYYSKDFRRIKDIIPINYDSSAVQVCFDSLSLKMQAQKRFSTIILLPFSSLPVQHVKNIGPPSKMLIKKISSDTHADALILLDMYSSFYSTYPNPDNDHSIAKVVTASIWTIYDPSKVKIIHHTSMVDTLYWDGLDDDDVYSASRIPNKKAALKIAAGLVGVNYSKNIVPNWMKVYRNTLSCNQTDFKKAAGLAKKNNWEEASALWGKYTESTKKRFRMQALFNLAIASELNGDIDTANELITKASKVSSSPFYATENEIIRKYSAVLAKRKIELAKINSQSYEL